MRFWNPSNISCRLCGRDIRLPGSSVYCRETVETNCASCDQIFFYKCQKRTRKYCSRECAATSTAKDRSRKEKTCEGCGELFLGLALQNYCNRKRFEKCVRCEREFSYKCWGHRKMLFCDSICWNLKTHWTPKEIREWKNLNSWAISFREEFSRKPGIPDFSSKFGKTSLPAFADKDLFHLVEHRGSYLELRVSEVLEEVGVVYRKDRRPVQDLEGRKLELDFWLPEQHLAFEIQDFATHSKEETIELTRWGKKKHGPDYHELKRTLAKEQLGVRLIDLWEDEILKKDFPARLQEILASS